MKRITAGIAILACGLSVLSVRPAEAASETLETNNPEVVVKRVYCVDYNLGGVLVNRAAQPFRGRLRVAVRDGEGDIVGRHSIRMRAGAETGARFEMYYINTLDCRRHTFEFTVE